MARIETFQFNHNEKGEGNFVTVIL